MKLYASVKSERAEEGQGGNEFLDIKITNDKREEFAVIKILPGEKNNVNIWVDKDLAELEISNQG